MKPIQFSLLTLCLSLLPVACCAAEPKSGVVAAPPAASEGKGGPKVADDPAAIEAFKRARWYRSCERDKDGNVTSLRLYGATRMESRASYELRLNCLEHLKGFPRLRKIETRTDNPNEDLNYIGELTELETLEIPNTELNNDGLIAIRNMTGLRRLSLTLNYHLTDAGLEHLAELKSLEDLDLSCTNLRGGGLSWLCGLKNLKKLDLDGSQATAAEMAPAAALTSLEELNLRGIKIRGAGLQFLEGLKKLKKLDLHGGDVTDAEMVHVAALASLEELNLSFTKVTSRSIGELSHLTRLKTLDLSGDDGTEPGAEALKKSLPKLQITLPSKYFPKPKSRRDRDRDAVLKSLPKLEHPRDRFVTPPLDNAPQPPKPNDP
jgi:Leucine-rich repeat (LRR) protein